MTSTASGDLPGPTTTINEAIVSMALEAPANSMLSFRCSKTLEVGLRRHALIHQVELSSLMRLLITEGARARGIDLTL